MSAAVDTGGNSFHSLMFWGGMKSVCAVCGTVAVGVAGLGLDDDDLGVAVVWCQVLQ